MTKTNDSSAGGRWTFNIATVRGIPVSVHASFLLLMVFLGWRTVLSSGLRVAVLEQVLVLAVFGCVALHELGHAAVAVRNGVPISGIVLYPFGGVARMARRPPRGMVEVLIASAGPAVNLLIAGCIFVASAGAVVAPGGGYPMRLLAMLFWANLILAAFNLLPAFPLDGGRVLRGLLTMKLGWARATVWAASIGQVAAVLLILAGFVYDFWLVLAGLLVLPAANAELRYALAVRQFADRRVGDLVRAGLLVVDGRATISDAAELSVAQPIADFLVTVAGRPWGYLSAPRLWAKVRSDEPGTLPVSTIAERLAAPIPAEERVEEAVRGFDPAGPGVAPVTGADGAVIGVVAVGDLARAVQLARHATRGA